MPGEYNVWDEFQWEEFMKLQDKRCDCYMELFFKRRDDGFSDNTLVRQLMLGWMSGSCQFGEFQNLTEYDEWRDEEGWKNVGGPDNGGIFEFRECNYLPLHRQTHEFATLALQIAEQLQEPASIDSSIVDFVSNAIVASSALAGGSCVGDDIDELGGEHRIL